MKKLITFLIIAIASVSTFATEIKEDKPGFMPALDLEIGILGKSEGTSGSNFSFAATIGGNYYFLHSQRGLFAGARIGYASASFNETMKSGRERINIEQNAHFITIPINAGWAFTNSKGTFGATPYAGIDLNCCVAGNAKLKYGTSSAQESKLKKKVGVDLRLGIQLRIGGFNVGGAYIIPLNDNQEMYFGSDAYPAISIGFGF